MYIKVTMENVGECILVLCPLYVQDVGDNGSPLGGLENMTLTGDMEGKTVISNELR